MSDAITEWLKPKATQKQTAPGGSNHTTPQNRRQQQRKDQDDRERARQARERELCDYLGRIFAAPQGGDRDVGAAVVNFVLSSFRSRDSVYRLAEKMKAATTSEGSLRNPDAFGVTGTDSPADIFLTRLACWDTSFFLDVLLYKLHAGRDGARVARMHRGLLEHEGIDLRARAKALGKAAGYEDEPRASSTGRYEKVRVIDRQLAATLLRELRDPIIRETEGGKALWAFANPSTDVLFGSALQPVKTEKAECAPTEWELARQRLGTWWAEHVDQSAPLPSPAEVRQIFVSNLASMKSIEMQVLHKFSGEDGQNPVGPLVAKGDALYGIATGGKYKAGVVFRMAPDGSDYGILHTFVGGKAHPSEPSSLVAGPADWLYGVCKMPRADFHSGDHAILFRVKTDGNGFEMVPMSNTEQPSLKGLGLYHGDEKGIYGVFGASYMGGRENLGQLLRISPDGQQELFGIEDKALGSFNLASDGHFYGIAYDAKSSSGDSVYHIRPDGSDGKIIHTFAGAPLDIDRADGPPVLIGGKLFGKGRSGSKDVMYELPAEGGEVKLYPFETRSLYAIALFAGPEGRLMGAIPLDHNGTRYELARFDHGQWKQMKSLATGGWIKTMQMLGNSELAGTVSGSTYGSGSLISVALAAESAPGVARRK